MPWCWLEPVVDMPKKSPTNEDGKCRYHHRTKRYSFPNQKRYHTITQSRITIHVNERPADYQADWQYKTTTNRNVHEHGFMSHVTRAQTKLIDKRHAAFDGPTKYFWFVLFSRLSEALHLSHRHILCIDIL